MPVALRQALVHVRVPLAGGLTIFQKNNLYLLYIMKEIAFESLEVFWWVLKSPIFKLI